MISKTRQLAIGGIFSALSFTLMFLSSFMPLTYLWVMFSGFVIMIIVTETGRKTAFLAYVSVALLCFILLPNVLIIMEFALLIGYYPIIKIWLDSINRILVRWVVKLAIFFASAVASLFITVYVLGIPVYFLQSEQTRFFIAIPVAQITIFAIAYDYFLRQIHQYYTTKLRPKIFHKKK